MCAEPLSHWPWSLTSLPQLAVNFREVDHSVRTGNADVAKPQRFAEDPMDTHKNARLTPKGREEMVRAVADRGMSTAAACAPIQYDPADRRQMGRSLLCRRRGWLARSILKTPFIAKPNSACHSRRRRKLAP